MTRRSLALRRPDSVSALRPSIAGYVTFTGASGEYLHDDRPLLTSVGTLEYGIKVRFSALNRAHNLAGWGSGASGLSVAANPPGNTLKISMINSVAGVIGGAASSVVIPAATATQPTWLRARVTVSTAICEYWYSFDATDDYEQVATWTPIGTPQTGTGAGTTPTLAGTDLQIVGNMGIGLPSMAGNVYAFVEKVNGVRVSWFTNADIPASPETEFVSAGGGQLWDMELWQTTSFTSSQSYSGGLRADFAFERENTGLDDETLLGVVDLDHQTVRVSYQPGLIPDHPTLGAYVESMLVRSTAGFPATNLDGLMMMRYLSSDPALNHGWASTIDSGLLGQQWYYYALFARYDDTSGWFKVAEEGWLNPGEYGYPERLWQGLPTYYRRLDHSTWIVPGYFRRIADAIGYEMDVLRSYATTLGDVWDFERISAKLLPEAGAALGLPQESANGDRRLRTLVGNAMALRKQKGTQQGIEGYVAALTGYPTRAYEGLNLLHRIQHTEWPNSFTAGTFSGAVGGDNNPGWSSQTGATVYGQVSRQIAASNEGSPVGLADGGFYLRVTNTTGATSLMDVTYGSDNAANGTNGVLSLVPVIGGHKYKFSTCIKASVAATTTHFKVDWFDQYGVAAGTTGNIAFVTIGTAWLRVYTATAITAPATACYAKIHLLVPALMAINAHINIWRPLFADVAWRPEGIPTLKKGNDALSSVQPEDSGTFRFWAYYEAPREVKINIYPNRTNFALNSDFTLNDQPPGAWSTYDAPTYAQLPVAYDSYADIIDAAPDWETSYADMASGLYPFSVNAPTIIYDPAGGRMHINKSTGPFGYTLMHTYFEAADLEGMSAAIGAYSSASTRGDAPGYLTATTGSISTPDPGPFPAKCTLIYKILGPTVSGGATLHTIAAQYDADPQRSWILRRAESTGGYAWTVSTGGTTASATSRSFATLTLPNTDQYLAVSIDLDVGSGNQLMTPWSSADGITWVADTAQAYTATTLRPFDSSGPIRIGAYTAANEPFEGRIYAVEMRTGADPNVGSNSTPVPGDITYPGTVGNHASIPDAANLRIVGDICIVARITPDDWLTAANSMIVSKWGPTSGQFGYRFYMVNNGTLRFEWTADGVNMGGMSSVVHGFTNALPKYAAFSLDVDNGSAQRVGYFWSSDNGTTWTAIGTPVVQAGITTIFASTSPVYFGSNNGPTGNNIAGSLSYVSIRNGIGASGAVGGTEVFTLNGVTDIPPGADPAATSIIASTGQTVTISRSGSPSTTLTAGGAGTYWRFDANDYPGSGTSYTDPRGRVWTLTTAAAITPYASPSQGTKLSMAFEWYTDNDVIYKMVGADGNPIRTYSPEYTLTTTEGRYECLNAQPPPGALYGRLLVILSNVVPHDTSFTWCLIEDAPYPEGYFNGNFPDGDDGDFYFAIGTGFTGAAHLSPSVYYQQFRHFAYGTANSDALSTLMPRLLPFRRSFKIVHAATGLYNKIV